MGIENEMKRLIHNKTEKSWVEFKVNWYEPNALGEYISAMSNAAVLEGEPYAYFIWGVDDKKYEIVGSTFEYNIDVKNEPLEHYLARLVTPGIAFSFHELKMEEKRIVVLRIPAASKVPTAFDGVRYLRIGSSKVNLNKYPERESELFFILRNGLPGVCNTESEYQDLTFDKLFVYYATKGITLHKNSHIPIRFAIFNGTTKASTMYSVREMGNTCLLYSLDKVLEYGEVLNVPQADERNRKVVRKEVPLFDAEAFREAIINAFVHNLWITGNAPMFTVFRERIEILSRGKLPPRQTVEGFFAGESVPVNQQLSDMFLQLHISERTGRGVPKITEVYGEETYEFRENSIVVSIPFTRVRVDENTKDATPVTTSVTTPVDSMIEGMFSIYDEERADKEKRILEFCISPKSILEIIEMLGFREKKSGRNYVKPLVEQGRLAMTIPDKPNSSKQKYITIK